MCGDPRCASDPRHARQECRLISENRVKVKLDGRGLPHYIYSVVAALRMMDALETYVRSHLCALVLSTECLRIYSEHG